MSRDSGGRFVQRQDFDPPAARELVFLCGRHELPGDQVDYRDAAGRLVPV